MQRGLTRLRCKLDVTEEKCWKCPARAGRRSKNALAIVRNAVALAWKSQISELLPLSAFVKLESFFTTCARLALGGISHLIHHQRGRDAADNGKERGRGRARRRELAGLNSAACLNVESEDPRTLRR